MIDNNFNDACCSGGVHEWVLITSSLTTTLRDTLSRLSLEVASAHIYVIDHIDALMRESFLRGRTDASVVLQ